MNRIKRFDIPIDAYENLVKKRNVLREMAKNEFKKPVKITLTDTLKFFSQKKVYVYNEELKNFLKQTKKKQGGFV